MTLQPEETILSPCGQSYQHVLYGTRQEVMLQHWLLKPETLPASVDTFSVGVQIVIVYCQAC